MKHPEQPSQQGPEMSQNQKAAEQATQPLRRETPQLILDHEISRKFTHHDVMLAASTLKDDVVDLAPGLIGEFDAGLQTLGLDDGTREQAWKQFERRFAEKIVEALLQEGEIQKEEWVRARQEYMSLRTQRERCESAQQWFPKSKSVFERIGVKPTVEVPVGESAEFRKLNREQVQELLRLLKSKVQIAKENYLEQGKKFKEWMMKMDSHAGLQRMSKFTSINQLEVFLLKWRELLQTHSEIRDS